MCRSPPKPPFTNTNNNNNTPSLVKNPTNNNNNNSNMETPLLHTPPQPAKANKRKRLNAVLDKLAGNMGMENMERMASTMDKMVTASANNVEESRPAATHLEISLSVAEERSTSEESEEERPHSSSSAVSSPKNEDFSPSSSSSNPFLSSLINPTTTTNSNPPGLDYLKSQLLSKMYLQQYMTNNLTNPVLPPASRIPEAPEGRRKPKESKREGKKLEVRRESKETRRDQMGETTECVGPLDLSRTSGPPSGKQPGSPLPTPANEDVGQKPSAPQQFPFPPFPSLLLPSSSSSSSPSSNSKEEEAVSPPPPSPPSKTTTTTTTNKGVVEASASPPGSTYSCPVCGQKFSLHDRLAKHMASRHKAHKVDSSQSKAYFCEVNVESKFTLNLKLISLFGGVSSKLCKE